MASPSAAPASPPLATRAPRWLLALYVLSTALGLLWAAAWTLGVVFGQYGSHPVENLVLNFFVWQSSLAVVSIQGLAFVGLYTRRHWGRPVATIAAGLWVLTGVGILFAALAWWGLHRRWDPGVESTFTREHPSAPVYVTGLAAAGTAVLLVWLWFLYIYLPNLINQIAPGAPDLRPVFTVALFISLPLWIVQGLAVVGLVRKHDWGVILALVTCVLWILSLVGLPFGIAGLVILWRWQHPALAPKLTGAPA